MLRLYPRSEIEQEVSRPWPSARTFPERHVLGPDGEPVPFHRGQSLTFDCTRRIIGMLAGTQGGKTIFGPVWLDGEIQACGPGDYFAITSTYDLFKLKLLPALLAYFEGELRTGRFWAGDRVLEICDEEGRFWAKRSTDPMYARVILRSAESEGGLESGTGKAAWLDEAGQERFTIDAWRAVLRRMALEQGRILITTTLYDVGWLDSEILKKAADGGRVYTEEVRGGLVETVDNPDADIGLVQFDSIVNPIFPPAEFERARNEMPDDEWNAFYRGRRVSSQSMIFDCLDPQRNFCPRFPIPDDWPRSFGIDFGPVHLGVIKFAEEPGTERIFAYEEYLAGHKTAKEHADDLLANEPGKVVAIGGVGSEDQWRREFGVAGLPIVEPLVSDFDVGVSRLYAMFKTGRLVIFDDLRKLKDELQHYRRKRDRQGNPTGEVENKNAFHLTDAARYAATRLYKEGRGKIKVLRLEHD